MSQFQLPPLNNADQFEDMICDLLNELNNNHSFKRFGKNGHSQKGVDIYSNISNAIIQCKQKDLSRDKILIKKELLADIENTVNLIAKKQPKITYNVLYLATTFSEHPDFDEYCVSLKRELKLSFDIVFWGWETIQAKIIDCPNTLSKYFANFIQYKSDNEQLTISRLDMKKKIEVDFAEWLNVRPENRKRRSRMIIHSIDDKHYPEHVLNHANEYQWFGAEIHGISHKGLEFTTRGKSIYVHNKSLWWTDIKPKDVENYTIANTAQINIIDFADIVGYDLNGDEHYICPHFFAKFNHNGTPFCYKYLLTMNDKNLPYYFDDNSKIN